MAQTGNTSQAYIDPGRCDRSPFCPAMQSCPARAIEIKGGGPFGFGGMPTVNPDKCTSCGLCVRSCPHGAIRIKRT